MKSDLLRFMTCISRSQLDVTPQLIVDSNSKEMFKRFYYRVRITYAK